MKCSLAYLVYWQKAWFKSQRSWPCISVIFLLIQTPSTATREHTVHIEGIVFGNLQRKSKSKYMNVLGVLGLLNWHLNYIFYSKIQFLKKLRTFQIKFIKTETIQTEDLLRDVKKEYRIKYSISHEYATYLMKLHFVMSMNKTETYACMHKIH